MRGKKTVRCIGGGPGGLFASLLLKKEYPEWDVVVYERNRADDTFGFGVVFSDETLGNLEDADPDSFREICESFAHWDEIDVFHKGKCIRSGGHGFSGLERMRLLEILQARCRSVGVELHFESEVTPESLPPADLVLVCDGVNSRFRAAREDVFGPIWTGAPTDLFGWGAVGRLMHLHSISEKTQPDSGGSMRISTRKVRAPSLWKRLKKRGKDQDWKEVRRRIRSATVRICSPRNWQVILSTEIVPCGDSSPQSETKGGRREIGCCWETQRIPLTFRSVRVRSWRWRTGSPCGMPFGSPIRWKMGCIDTRRGGSRSLRVCREPHR